jgi:hypothetical protein
MSIDSLTPNRQVPESSTPPKSPPPPPLPLTYNHAFAAGCVGGLLQQVGG